MNVKLEKSLGCVLFQRIALTDALKKLSLVISAKSSLEIFQAVKFEVTKDEILLSATDADTTAIVRMDNDYNCHPQTFIVGHKRLMDFLKKSKAKTIEFEKLDYDMVNIQASKVNFKIQGYDASNYPVMPQVEYDYLNMNVNDFKDAMKNTLFACSTSDSRPMLQSVNIIYNSKHIQFVATDSHRLGQYTNDEYHSVLEMKGNPSGYVLNKITKLISKNAKNIEIGFSKHHMLFKFDDVEFLVRNIEGNYPQTERLIPEDFKSEFRFESAEMLESANMMKIIASDAKYGVIKLDAKESDKTVLFAEKIETNEKIESELNVFNFFGDDLRIAFNNQYFIDAINALDCDDIKIQFNGSMRPFIMYNAYDNKAVQLILPVRTYQ